MALYRLDTKSISRGAGRSAPAAAAYRAGQRIRDLRTGVLHNYSQRRDVTHTEILLPAALSGSDANWARDRATLWNQAEAAERRRDARVAREFQVKLPEELSAAQRVELARTFAMELAERHHVAVDLAVHEPRAGGDPRNHHAHLLVTSREVHALGFGGKAGLDMSSVERSRRGLAAGLVELVAIRERWATLTNDAYRAAGMTQRVDHRSLKAQGIDREPLPRIPFAAYQMERRGVRSLVAERIRARYRARVAARALGAQQADPAVQENAPLPGVLAEIDALRQRARAAWLELRGAAPPAANPGQAATPARSLQAEPTRSQAAAEQPADATDRDFGL